MRALFLLPLLFFPSRDGNGAAGPTFEVATINLQGGNITMREMAETLSRLLGVPVKLTPVAFPNELQYAYLGNQQEWRLMGEKKDNANYTAPSEVLAVDQAEKPTDN